MNMRLSLLISLCLLGFVSVFTAQSLAYRQGELLVKLYDGITEEAFSKAILTDKRTIHFITKISPVAPTFHIYKVYFDFTKHSEREMMAQLREMDEIEFVQLNELAQRRSTVPNDPLFNNQWQYINTGQLTGAVIGADLDVDLAWDVTTGGVTSRGDTIVVCIIDDGLDPRHDDIKPNTWRNYHEIPDNGIDDDENGYVDDFLGWDFVSNDNDPYSLLSEDFHGTPISAIIGARGNNQLGISGINWNVKIMMIRGLGSLAAVLSSYEYAVKQRKLYNQTNGAKGAFIVATNSSFGFSREFPSDRPMLCPMYDSLGKVGILSAVATDNSNINVDEVGDLPSTCTSNYMICVSNVDHTGEKVTNAAYGSISVDIAAPGDFVYTAKRPNSYGEFYGTSSATPHVAGAIALLYASPCQDLGALAISEPQVAAQIVRDAILNSTVHVASFVDKSTTEGRLNIFNAMMELQSTCTSCTVPVDWRLAGVTDTRLDMQCIMPSDVDQILVRYRTKGTSPWEEFYTSSPNFSVSNLQPCTNYEMTLQSICMEDSSAVLAIQTFRTDGCCDIPSELRISHISDRSIQYEWQDVLAADTYEFRYREIGAGAWITQMVTGETFSLSTEPCQSIEAQIRSNCTDSLSAFSDIITATSEGCGVCLDHDYCDPPQTDVEFDYIARVGLDDISHFSDREGYGDFTDFDFPHLELGKSHTLYFNAGYIPSGTIQSHTRVWIDYNADGLFSTSELVVDSYTGDTSTFHVSFEVPRDAQLGATRMRVAMRFNNDPTSCNQGQKIFGEYEDYCVTIDRESGIHNPTNPLDHMIIYPNPFSDQLFIKTTETSSEYGRWKIFNASGELVHDFEISSSLHTAYYLDTSQWPSGVYFIQYQSRDGLLGYNRILIK